MHFDKEKLFQKIGSDEELLANILDIALDEFPQYVVALQKAIVANDQVAVKKAAHTIKGSAFNMEFNNLGELAHEIEKCNKDEEEVHRLFNALEQEWDAVLKSV